jgi:hypothetical protein
MSSQEIQSDAQFYNLIYQLTGTPRDDKNAERRRSRRHAFLCKQRIAPWPPTSGKISPPDFVEVRCQNLNQAGFSFLLPERPSFVNLVAALSSTTEEIYILGEITNCSEVLVYPSGRIESAEGRPSHVRYREPGGGVAERMFQLGCRFTSRIARVD